MSSTQGFATQWLLTPRERNNPYTLLDRCREEAFTRGNRVRALVHGAEYFGELCERVAAMTSGDLIMFTDWRGDPNEMLAGPGTAVSTVLSQAAGRGVHVKGLIWRSHWDRLAFSAEENEYLGEEIEAAGGECVRDMRVRMGGSHHQKLVVLRHQGRPECDIAFVGGIDLCHGRRDDERHLGDPQPLAIAPAYGPTPPWHDVQLAVQGPAVADIEFTFRERWGDPAPLSRNPLHRLHDLLRHDDTHPGPLPPALPEPPPIGQHCVQVLRTYPYRRRGYPFAPQGERSLARAYQKALGRARSLIYLEDQYLWSAEVADLFARALAEGPDLRLVCVVPLHPDQGGLAGWSQVIGRRRAIATLQRAGGDRVAIYGIENGAGTPIYVHAKACVIDDTWTCIGSDNINLRSWTYDSELAVAIADDEAAGGFGQTMRLRLHREHLERDPDDDADLRDPAGLFEAYAESARQLDAWHDAGASGPRPRGRLRRYREPALPRVWMPFADAMYRLIADPDGRPRALRRAHVF
jgi:phosphatidylserine/phosphatidylglycerophosphate/cardiolipin synthase-like enzyme